MQNVLDSFQAWYAGLRKYSGKFPAKGTLSGALVVLERLRVSDELNIESYTAQGGSQIKGAGEKATSKILARFSEYRPFVSEGGRTNRGLRGDIQLLLEALKTACIDELSRSERLAAIDRMQEHLVDQIREWHNKQRIEVVYDESKTTRELVLQILTKAKERGQDGPIAQYLVGAKLQLRYPDLEIENHSYSTADMQLGRGGDFVICDTAFHVTVSPMDHVYDRCLQNLKNGMKAYLLVPQSILVAARTNADSVAPSSISVESVEGFVGGNVDELSRFSRHELSIQIRELINIYNQRVDIVEIDKSMMIEMPHNLSSIRASISRSST